MDSIYPLLDNALSALLIPILLGVRALRKAFATSALPTIPGPVITLLLLALAEGLAYANLSLHPDAASTGLAGIAWVQGLLFWFGLLIADLGFDATSIKTPAALSAIARNAVLLVVGAGAALAIASSPAVAADSTRSMLSLSRLSAGPRLVAQVYDFDNGSPREVGFVLGAAASYNVTSAWDLKADAERKLNAGDLVPPEWRWSAGAHVRLPISNDHQGWYLGLERAWYTADDPAAGAGSSTSSGQWVVRLQWAFGAQTKSGRDYAFAIVRARYDVPDAEHEGRRDVGLGIQPQLIGGK